MPTTTNPTGTLAGSGAAGYPSRTVAQERFLQTRTFFGKEKKSLAYRNRKLAVDEAKAWDEALTEGVAQAKELRR